MGKKGKKSDSSDRSHSDREGENKYGIRFKRELSDGRKSSSDDGKYSFEIGVDSKREKDP